MLLPLSVMGHRLCAKVSLGTFHVLSEDLACLEICFSTEHQQPTDQRTVTYFAPATASPRTAGHCSTHCYIYVYGTNIAIIIILCK